MIDEETKERLKRKAGCYFKTVEKEHGGVAVGEYYITEDAGRYSEKKQWKGLKGFGVVDKKAGKARWRKGGRGPALAERLTQAILKFLDR